MPVQMNLANEPVDERRNRYVPTYWKCVNWHNLMTQEGPLAGDIYNLGKIQSGKTTYLDGCHATLTGGDEYMAWNSAADPTSTARSNPEGRRLKDIVCRVNDDGVQRPDGGISYFALELTNPATKHVITLCLGAQARSMHSAIERWGMLIERPLREIALEDDDGEVKGKERLAEEYGSQHVHAKIGRYREHVAQHLFGTMPNYERVHDFWEMGKSYTRLLKQGQDVGELVRAVLPDPDPEEFDKTRSQIKDIRALDNTIGGLGVLQSKLSEIQAETKRVTRARDRFLRYDYADKKHALDTLLGKIQALAQEITRTEELVENAKAAESRTDTELKLAEDTLAALSSQVDAELLRASKDLKEKELEQDKLVQRIGGERDLAERQFDSAMKAKTNAKEALANALAEFADTLTRFTSGKEPDLQKSSVRLAQAAAAASTAERDAKLAFDAAVREWRRAGDKVGLALERKQQDLAAAHSAILDDVADLERQLRELDDRKDIPPIEGLDEALQGINEKVIVTYRAIEPRLDRDAFLLEQFLPPTVLGAIIPIDATSTEVIKAKVHAKCPSAKIVDRERLRETSPIGPGTLLHALDPTRSHPLALAYLAHEYGEVQLLAPGTPKGAHERVVWRDGQVYDGIAWQLEHLKGDLQFVGREATRRRIEQARARLKGDIEEHTKLAKTKQGELRDAEVEQEQLAVLLQNVEYAHTRLDLDERVSGVVALRLEANTKRDAKIAKTKDLENASGVLSTIREELSILERQIAEKDMVTKNEELQAAIARRNAITKRRDDGILARGKLEGNIERARAERVGLEREEPTQRNEEQAAVLALLPVAQRAGYQASDIQIYLESEHVKGINRATAKDNRKAAETEEKEAIGRIGALLNEAAKWRALRYDATANVVVETSSNHDIERLAREVGDGLSERMRQRTHKLEDLTSKQIIYTLVADLKRNRDRMMKLIKSVNEVLKRTPFQGSTYHLKHAKNKDDPEIARITNLVEEFSAENQRELANFIQTHLVGVDVPPGKVPPLLDYRNWYSFTMMIERAGREEEVTKFVRKASGGGKALPHYLMCFGLFNVLYNSVNAKARIVFIDEAFRNMDADTIDDIIGFAKNMSLDLVVAAPELSGRTSRMDNATVHMFAKDDATQEAHVRPFIQETR